MRSINNKFRNAALCILAAMLSVSCLLEKEGPSVEMQGVMIQMSVSAPGMTKAEYEDPTAAEKTINTLRVYAFYGDRLAGYTSRTSTAPGDPFYMDLELPADGIHEVDFYLIANEAEMRLENGVVQLSENMTKSQLESLVFTGLVHRNVLPMYCRKLAVKVNVDAVLPESNTEEGHEGHFVLAEPVSFTLERSVAKLSVYAAKTEGATADPEILSVDLLAKGTRQYSFLFEQQDAALDAVESLNNNRELVSSKVVIGNSVVKGSAEAGDPSNYTVVVDGIYLPEVREGLAYDDPSYTWNTFTGAAEDEARAAVLYVRYSMGEGQDIRHAYIYLPRVERNHHIQICILINAEGQIIINYKVADWDWDTDKMMNWFFDYPTHTYIWHAIPQDEEDLHAKPGIPATMSASVAFKGYFKMTYPDNDKWTPTLEGLHASHCEVVVFNDRTGDKVFDSASPAPLPVSEDWFRIEVTPKSGYMDPDDQVNLAITYTPSGMTETEYLLINGSHPEFFWENSTSENYITITMVN